MVKSKLSWQVIIPITTFIVLMIVNFLFVKTFWFGEEFYFKDPFLNLGMFMISMLISISVLYDLTCNLTLFKLKEDTFEIRTIFKKDGIDTTDTRQPIGLILKNQSLFSIQV